MAKSKKVEIKKEPDQQADAVQPQTNSEQAVLRRRFDTQFKAIALLISVISLFVLLALISYNPSDEQNVQIRFFDLFSQLSNNDEIEAKASVTKNWLGLTGAWISDFIYNGTLGYYAATFPLVVIIYAMFLFTGKKITKNIIKYTIIYLLLGLFFSGFIGSLQTIDFLSQIPKEWSGRIGQYTSYLFYSFLGSIGAVIIFATGMVLILYLGTELKVTFDKSKFKDWIKSKFTFLKQNFNEKIEYETSEYQEETVENTQDEKPAATVESNISENIIVTTPAISQDKTIIDNTDPLNMIRKSPKISIKSIPDDSEKLNPFAELTKLNDTKKETEPVAEIPKIPEKKEEVIAEPEIIKVKNEEIINNVTEAQEDLIESEPIEQKKNELKIKLKPPIQKMENREEVNEDEFEQHAFQSLNLDKRIEKDEERVIPTIKQQNESTSDPHYIISNNYHEQSIKYIPPSFDLLNQESSETNVNELELTTNAQILQEKLETFKIFIEDLTVTPGPVVTQYEFVPAPGIKISKIEGLADDLAMALKAKGIRIIAPIPGKGTIGVEIPNTTPSIVRFGEVVNSSRFANTNAKLPLALGKTISGEVYIADLTKMPHLLIAGSTGSGKSVGINTVITSLLYKRHPSELKFVIIDPKKVELQQYAGLVKHFMATSPDIEDIIVTKPEDAIIVLKAAVKEMELRYDILASVGQRNIADYNDKVKQGKIKDTEEMAHKPIPYIVVIVDELADLMLTASKEIEEPITRLAQMARAIGIHLVIATQRPSVDVITGIIKANFPARIAYLVASKIDSRTILDMQGAEQLLGMGDMLCLPPGQPKPVRIQNAFISTDEVEAVCDFIYKQRGYSAPYMLPSLLEKSTKGPIDPLDRDPLFEEAARIIIRTQQGSVSMLQRRLKIGYARAGRIVDELESAGVVGPFDGSKARQVLMESEMELEAVL